MFDPEKPVTIHQRITHYNQDRELHEGLEATGRPTMTILRGDIIVKHSKVNAEPGRGRLVTRRAFTS